MMTSRQMLPKNVPQERKQAAGVTLQFPANYHAVNTCTAIWEERAELRKPQAIDSDPRQNNFANFAVLFLFLQRREILYCRYLTHNII